MSQLDLGFALNPRTQSVLDVRTFGTESDRPTGNSLPAGILRYETAPTLPHQVGWPKWVYTDANKQWQDFLGQGVTPAVLHELERTMQKKI